MKKTKRVQQKNKEGLRFGAAFFFVAERRSHPGGAETWRRGDDWRNRRFGGLRPAIWRAAGVWDERAGI